MARVPAGYNRCITGVTEAAGRDLSDDELTDIFTKVQGRARRMERAGMSRSDAMYQAGLELGKEMKLAASIEKRSLLINAARRREVLTQLRDGKEALDLRAVLNRIDANVYGAQADVLGPLVNDMQKAGLMKVIAKGDAAFDQKVIDELWAIESGGKSVTGDKNARRAAEIIDKAQERVRTQQNEAGAWIGRQEHYVARQSHDMDKIRGTLKGATPEETSRLNFEAWRDSILPKLDERTFDHLSDLSPEGINAYLRMTWNALATGLHESSNGRELLAGFTGPGNLAKKASAERKLFFKDSASWGEYNREFGRGTLWESVQRGLDSGARNTALMRTLGTNPEALFNAVVDNRKVAARDRGDLQAFDALNKQFNNRILDTITGKANIPSNSGLATFARTVTTMQTLSKLGGVVLSSLPDLVNNAAALRHNGVGLFESYANQVASLFPKNAAGKEAMTTLGVGVDSMLGHVGTRFSSAEGIRGKSAKLVDMFHRANLLTFWTDSMKHGLGSMLSHNLGRSAGLTFDGLHPRLQNTLGLYDISAADWNTARKAMVRTADGVDRVLPAEIADEAVRRKFQTYMTDQIREAMTEPDAVSRTVATGGLAANTPAGMAMRVLMQFKTYPITFINRTLGREGLNPFSDSFGKGRSGMDVAGITHLIVGMSLMGYLSMELKNLAKGRNPRTSDANDRASYASLVAAAMAQGGGFGLFGDFLFGEADRNGGGFFDSLLGPSWGTLKDVGNEVQNLAKWAREGDPRALSDARSGALGLIKNNTPFVNMFYTRLAADHFIWHRLQEAANPGYLARLEQRVRSEQHQSFWLSPTSAQ